MWPLIRKSTSKAKAVKKTKKTGAKRGKQQEQSLIRRRRIDIFMRSAILLVVCVAVIGSTYIWKSGLLQEWMMEAEDAVDRKVSDAGFSVKEVRITGQANTELKQVRAALALYDGQSMISLDLDKMLGRVEGLPWVKKATITRIMPDILDVKIMEYRAVAIWQKDDQLFLVNGSGEVITDQGLDIFHSLPHVVGVKANENITSLLTMKNTYPELFEQVKSSVWVGQRRWDLNLHNGIKVKLPEKGSELAWQQLNDYQNKQKLLNKDILVVDMRQHGKVILRLTEQEAKRRKSLINTGEKPENI